MAFNSQQDFNQRKILEELNQKKNLIVQKGITGITGNSTAALNGNNWNALNMLPLASGTTELANNISIRSHWQQANSAATQASFGFFIQTDSGQFGNPILPVLPRHDPPTNNSN